MFLLLQYPEEFDSQQNVTQPLKTVTALRRYCSSGTGAATDHFQGVVMKLDHQGN